MRKLPAWMQEALNDPELMRAAKDAATRMGGVPSVITPKIDWTDEELQASIAEDDYILGEGPDPRTPAPMTWEAFVEMATAEGWELKSVGIGRPSEMYVMRLTANNKEIAIWGDLDFCFNDRSMGHTSNWNEAYAAANAVAEAVGGWR